MQNSATASSAVTSGAGLYPHFGILLVDDEVSYQRSLALLLERKAGINHLYFCSDSLRVMDMLAEHPIRIVLLDLNMPRKSGGQLLHDINEAYPDVVTVIISGLNQVETAVDCLRQGAFDFFVKTTETDRLLEGIKRAIEVQEIKSENQALRQRVLSRRLDSPESFARILTQSRKMASVFQYLESVAGSTQPLMICGESGTGKELIAQAVHDLSGRPGKLVTVNVAGLDDHIFNDTLFGHRKGAFTGADSERRGLVETAAGGTLFLDEIGDLSPGSQVKLLRLLQEGEYYPMGADRPERSQARIFVATHQNLDALQKEGRFRRDLYYRLCTHQVQIPPLRARREDIRLLFSHFLEQAAADVGREVPELTSETWAQLQSYHFPGNVRELRAIAFDALSRSDNGELAPEHLSLISDAGADEPAASDQSLVQFPLDRRLPSLAEMDEILIEEALFRADYNQSIAAQFLGISQPALSKRLKRMRNPEQS
ncbi:MAG: sigma-54 dependent transcriptional regulator [Natronospirillum sp.]|uniref:sigma-54-dependent transcriptional regulator n=1 Tax=Natronospirillum sp. TaxID=2812955 RepID=UPI0025DEF9B0|nr:sigma-54 dependent transcriptional regulator [Natronospirillum sp.]MCH8550304.1 sigma-54 dependent transcriptional regulator [Natronospirillum sp.]